ncbi:MAG: hypothetical protein AAGE52_14930 [Myxococcota bacterium]
MTGPLVTEPPVTEPPAVLSDSLPTQDQFSLRQWWARLSVDERSELAHLWDPRSDDIAWSRGRSLPIRLQGRPVVDRQLGPDSRIMRGQLLDFVLNHEEIGFFLEKRRFHICRLHTQARQILEDGTIPDTFRCTLRGHACAFERVACAAENHTILVQLRFGSTPQ